MAVRTFRADTMKEAIGQVKSDLGAEAMILSTKRFPRGPQNPYGKDFIEITAAPQDDLPDLVAPVVGRSREKRISRGDVPMPNSGSEKWQDIRSELSEIKDMLLASSRMGSMDQLLGLHPTCLNVYSRLLRMGISEKNAWRFMDEGGAFASQQDLDPEGAAKKVVQAMLRRIVVAEPFSGKHDKRYAAAFVGPTGVGKTTTIAKLSAELCLKQKKKVGIISVDSYRIGAVDQLKTYANIMGLPFLSAFSKEDLGRALKKMADRDVVLIDTAGQSHRDMKRLKELGDLLGEGFSIDTHLVLSAATKSGDMGAAADNFSILQPSTYVFTKVDETGSRGGLLNQMLKRSLPVSYITNGQRVPEDIVSATPRRVLRLILQGPCDDEVKNEI